MCKENGNWGQAFTKGLTTPPHELSKEIVNTYLNSFGLWKILKIEKINFEGWKISKITFQIWWAPNKILKRQIFVRTVFHHQNN
jgi:hypothetical protein